MFEFFDDFEDTLTWTTSDSSVYIKDTEFLYIGADGDYNDWAERTVNLELSSNQKIAIEQRLKLESGGLNYRLPGETLYFRDGKSFGITYLGTDEAHPDPTYGWLFGNWTGSYEHGVPGTGWWTSATANYWAVTKIALNSTESELFVKPDDLERGWFYEEYYKVAHANWSHSNIIKIRFSQNWDSVNYIDWMRVRAYTSPAPTITISPDPGNTTTSHIHIDGKNCVNMPFVARLTDTDGNPIATGTIIYSIGGAQFVKTTDASGYSTFTPTTTGTLLAIYGNESVTCEIIDDPTLCTGGCNFGTDPQADDLAITSFTTDRTTYAGGETMTITIEVENSAGEMYKKLLIDTSSTKSDTGLPLGFVGSWSFVDLGSSTYEMRLYIPTSTDPGTYNVAGGMYTDYLADGGSILDIASQVSVTIT